MLQAAAGAAKPVLRVLIDADGVEPGAGAGDGLQLPGVGRACAGPRRRRAAWLRRPSGRVPELPGIDRTRAEQIIAVALAEREEAWLDAGESERLLGAYGIPLIGEHGRDAGGRRRSG